MYKYIHKRHGALPDFQYPNWNPNFHPRIHTHIPYVYIHTQKTRNLTWLSVSEFEDKSSSIASAAAPSLQHDRIVSMHRWFASRAHIHMCMKDTLSLHIYHTYTWHRCVNAQMIWVMRAHTHVHIEDTSSLHIYHTHRWHHYVNAQLICVMSTNTHVHISR